jgi:adenine-specific DNA-methyltransferase
MFIERTTNMLVNAKQIPSLIKYMGSKTEIITEIVSSLDEIYDGNQVICDLFSGSSTLSGALRLNDITFVSNDIQKYSELFAKAYSSHYNWGDYYSITHWLTLINGCVDNWREEFDDYYQAFDYSRTFSLAEFTEIEEQQRALLTSNSFQERIKNSKYKHIKDFHLFTIDYSGTYWSFSQCNWIDSCKYVISTICEQPELSDLLLCCLMYAMAYNSQSTGHYAQYRKALIDSSMNDILIYRRKQLQPFFERKYNELSSELRNTQMKCTTTQLDYLDCINTLPAGSLIYADPPYCFVHYSRFYHILETLVEYDYPTVEFEGRYRNGRHQSPFCISSQVANAFRAMFKAIKDKNCDLVLSYSKSKTTMIPLSTLVLAAYAVFNDCISYANDNLAMDLEEKINYLLEHNTSSEGSTFNITDILPKSEYEIRLKLLPYEHSTMGRADIKNVPVYEALILAKHRVYKSGR